jgi:hypothetical protein
VGAIVFIFSHYCRVLNVGFLKFAENFVNIHRYHPLYHYCAIVVEWVIPVNIDKFSFCALPNATRAFFLCRRRQLQPCGRRAQRLAGQPQHLVPEQIPANHGACADNIDARCVLWMLKLFSLRVLDADINFPVCSLSRCPGWCTASRNGFSLSMRCNCGVRLTFLRCARYFYRQVSNVIFALFTEGLLKVCDKLSNPCSLEETSFSERVYGTLACVLVLFSCCMFVYALRWLTVALVCDSCSVSSAVCATSSLSICFDADGTAFSTDAQARSCSTTAAHCGRATCPTHT